MATYVMSDIHGMYGPFMRRIKQLDNLKSVKSGEDKLILLGDYVDVGMNSYKVLQTIYDLKQEVGDNLIVLMGNHDKWFLRFLLTISSGWMSEKKSFEVIRAFLSEKEADGLKKLLKEPIAGIEKFDNASRYVSDIFQESHKDLIAWYKDLPLFYETDRQIYVHAGIDEKAGEKWKLATSDDMFTDKYPASRGQFYKDIVAGHVSVSSLSNDRSFHDVFWDGASHFYIDGIDSYANNVWDDNRVIPLLVYEETDGCGIYYSLSESGEKRVIKE